MTDLITPANFEFFARYLLAGYIITAVRSRYAVGERPRLGDWLFEAVVLSLLNQFVFFLLLHAAALFLPVASFDARVLFFAEVLALPLALGWLAGINLAKGWNQAVLRRLSMPVQAPIRRAYDHAFADDAAGRFVILSFQDGTKVYGYFGERSLAANDGERSDIFLERLYDVSDDGQWYEKLPHRSGLMMLDGLRSIEFMLPEEGRDAPNRTDASD
jgi:hypothetical protein